MEIKREGMQIWVDGIEYVPKASHTTEVKNADYRIMSFKYKIGVADNSVYLKEDEGLYYYRSGMLSGNLLSHLFEDNWDIHSVRRLSDNEVFSVGDEVETNGGRGRHTITEFKLFDGDVMCIGMKGFPVYYEFLNRISKPLQRTPLFVSEEGKNIFEGDTYWAVRSNYTIGECTSRDYKMWGEKITDSKRFSTEESATEYVTLNNPCLSVNDVLEITRTISDGAKGYDTRNYLNDKLKEFVKHKLDKQ